MQKRQRVGATLSCGVSCRTPRLHLGGSAGTHVEAKHEPVAKFQSTNVSCESVLTHRDLFTRAWSDRTRGDGCKLKEGRFRLDTRKNFFTQRVVRPWSRLPRAAVAAPSLAGLKARLDGALSTLVWWKAFLPWASGVGMR